MPTAWNFTTGNTSIIVAVIDDGFEKDHPDLNENIWSNQPEINGQSGVDDDNNGFIDDFNGWDFEENDNGLLPDYSCPKDYHGTSVAGIIAGETNNNLGVSGIAGGWNGQNGVKLMLLKTECPGPTISNVAKSIRYAISNNASVINISSSWLKQFGSFDETIDSATTIYDCVIVASSGNIEMLPKPNGVLYPANHPKVIAVGATLNDDTIWDFSERGPSLDVVAPGGEVTIWTTDLEGSQGANTEGDYTEFGGTSAAAPHVAGLAALLRSMDNTLSYLDVKDIIEQTADDLGPEGYDTTYGWGRINAYKALRSLPPSAPTGLYISGGSGQNPTLHWNANTEPDILKYHIYRKVPGTSNYSHIASTISTQYTDISVTIGNKFDPQYCYKVSAEDSLNNESGKTGSECIRGVGPVGKLSVLPKKYKLSQNHPNPFNPTTTIRFDLPENTNAQIIIYDIVGREVMKLQDGYLEAGYHSAVWMGLNASGNDVPTGIYFARLVTPYYSHTIKMVMMK